MSPEPTTPTSSRSQPSVVLLPPGSDSLARNQIADAPADTLCVLTQFGGIQVGPDTGFTVLFGRNEPDVHVCVGRDDAGVSRIHGSIRHDGRRWRLRNDGVRPIRFPGSHLLLSEQSEPLPRAYTPLFIETDANRQHLIEVRVNRLRTGSAPAPAVAPDDQTRLPKVWLVKDVEKLVLVVLGQRYLRHDSRPQPVPWGQVAEELHELQPEVGWNVKKAQNRVREVRLRLAAAGVPQLTEEEIPPPLGNSLNHNLLMVLLRTTTLVPPDLRALDGTEQI